MPETYCVIPLEKNSKPYLKQMSAADQMGECMYFKLSTLKAIKSHYPNPFFTPLETLIAQHMALSKKLKLNDMNKYGKAAFAKKCYRQR